MKLKECLDFGKNYAKINQELNELYEDLKVKEPEYYASHYKEKETEK